MSSVYKHHLIQLLMNKIHEVNLKHAVKVQLSYSLNQQILGNNFTIILDCLKELNSRQDTLQKSNDQIGNLQKEIDRLKQYNLQIQKQKGNEKFNSNAATNLNRQSSALTKQRNDDRKVDKSQSDEKGLQKQLKQLREKVGKHESNILDTIKDINILNKELKDVRQLINGIKNSLGQKNQDKFKKNEGDHQITNDDRFNIKFNELKKQIQKNSNNITQIEGIIQKLKKKLENTKQNTNEKTPQSSAFNEASYNDLQEALNKLKDRLDIQSDKLRSAIENIQENNQQIQFLREGSEELTKDNIQHKHNFEIINNQIDQIKKMLEMSQKHHENELKALRNDLSKAKKLVGENSDHKNQKINSNTSFDDNQTDKNGNSNNKNGIYTQNRFLNNKQDEIKELRERLDALERIMSSKTSINNQKSNPEKFPSIKRQKPSLIQNSAHNQRDHNSNKKELAEVKNQIQVWVKSYMENLKDKNALEELEMRLQEMKNALTKKADHEGMKKGLTFLQTKINQLYLFLTEPDTEDAMIVRKGFNCLSCSKKVEKLRGRLGPHINWNNMTATNYSPPRVGYSKQMGDNSADKESQI